MQVAVPVVDRHHEVGRVEWPVVGILVPDDDEAAAVGELGGAQVLRRRIGEDLAVDDDRSRRRDEDRVAGGAGADAEIEIVAGGDALAPADDDVVAGRLFVAAEAEDGGVEGDRIGRAVEERPVVAIVHHAYAIGQRDASVAFPEAAVRRHVFVVVDADRGAVRQIGHHDVAAVPGGVALEEGGELARAAAERERRARAAVARAAEGRLLDEGRRAAAALPLEEIAGVVDDLVPPAGPSTCTAGKKPPLTINSV